MDPGPGAGARLMPQIADSIDQLTAEWFTEALREGGVLDGDASVASAENAIYGTGQFGFVVRSELAYEGDAGDAPASVIVKIPSDDESARGFAKLIGAYEVEVRFYSDLLPRTDVGAPKAFWGDVEPETSRFTLVIEDLTPDWTVGDAIAGGTPEQAAAAMDQLVKLQAPIWDDPALREPEWLASPARTQALFGLVEPAMPGFKERFGARVPPEHLALAERLAPKAALYPGEGLAGAPGRDPRRLPARQPDVRRPRQRPRGQGDRLAVGQARTAADRPWDLPVELPLDRGPARASGGPAPPLPRRAGGLRRRGLQLRRLHGELQAGLALRLPAQRRRGHAPEADRSRRRAVRRASSRWAPSWSAT